MKKFNLTNTEIALIEARRTDKKSCWDGLKNEPIMKRLGIRTYDDYEKVERSFMSIKWFLEQMAEQRGADYVKQAITGLFTADELEFMTGWTYCEDFGLYEVGARVVERQESSIVDALKIRRPVKNTARSEPAERTITIGDL
jgi:hypothetical protein